MSNQSPALHTPNHEPRPVLAIGGVLAGPECALLYKPLLNDKLEEWQLTPAERFVPIPTRGRQKFTETIKRLEEDVLARQQKLGRAVVLVGHSMGALYAQEVELNNPDIASDVVLAAGAHEGKRYGMPGTFLLRHVLGNPPHAPELNHDSEMMKAHVERVATQWPNGVGLHAVSTVCDDLLPFTHGMKLELPEGQEAQRHVIALPLPGTTSILRLLARNPDIKHQPSLTPPLHSNIVCHSAFIKYVRNLQTRQQIHPQNEQPFSAPSALAA
jgi:pimeloyl-ACP methyl ester carboxylesterase